MYYHEMLNLWNDLSKKNRQSICPEKCLVSLLVNVKHLSGAPVGSPSTLLDWELFEENQGPLLLPVLIDEMNVEPLHKIIATRKTSQNSKKCREWHTHTHIYIDNTINLVYNIFSSFHSFSYSKMIWKNLPMRNY